MYHVWVGGVEREVRAKQGDVGSDTVEILTHTPHLLVCILAVLSCGNKKYPSGGFVNCRGVSTCTWTRSVKVTLSSLHTPGGHSAVSWISPTPGLRV